MTSTNPPAYRAGLPPIPWRLRSLPIERGYPVPWFCSFIDGHYDFRIADDRKKVTAIREKRCWICGQPLGQWRAFVIGPMCAINRISGEPPAHRECADWSARACPFLTQQENRRNASNLPENISMSEHGIPRQPDVALLWITRTFELVRADTLLFRIGEPSEVRWYRESRPATRAEVLESIDSGYPILADLAEQDGPEAVTDLTMARSRAMQYLPVE